MDYYRLLGRLTNNEGIDEGEFSYIVCEAIDVVKYETPFLQISAPVCVCGDVHGQFDDLMTLFRVGGSPKEVSYLFLGDYVDRGMDSISTISLLMIYKILYRDRFYLLRGNHESRDINEKYGFYEEIISKYGNSHLWHKANQFFDILPMAAIIEQDFFCVHGGLSPNIKLIEEIVLSDTNKELPTEGPLADICWSDPDDSIEAWMHSPRGAGFLFGYKPTKMFCFNNGVRSILRAHQLAIDGFVNHYTDNIIFTIWSAPNYMYRTENVASIMSINQDLSYQFLFFQSERSFSQVPPDIQTPDYFQ